MSITMLFKAPGPHEIHGGKFDYIIVPDDEVESKVADGWFLTTPEAFAAKQASDRDAAVAAKAKRRQEMIEELARDSAADPDNAPVTKAELQQRCRDLGIEFDARWGVAKLNEALAAKG